MVSSWRCLNLKITSVWYFNHNNSNKQLINIVFEYFWIANHLVYSYAMSIVSLKLRTTRILSFQEAILHFGFHVKDYLTLSTSFLGFRRQAKLESFEHFIFRIKLVYFLLLIFNLFIELGCDLLFFQQVLREFLDYLGEFAVLLIKHCLLKL